MAKFYYTNWAGGFSQGFEFNDETGVWTAITSLGTSDGNIVHTAMAVGADLMFVAQTDASLSITEAPFRAWQRSGFTWVNHSVPGIPPSWTVLEDWGHGGLTCDYAGNMIAMPSSTSPTTGKAGIVWFTRSGTVYSYGGRLQRNRTSPASGQHVLRTPAISPDGRWMVVFLQNQNVSGDTNHRWIVYEWTGVAWTERTQVEPGLIAVGSNDYLCSPEWRPDSEAFVIPIFSGGAEPFRAFFLTGTDQFTMAPTPDWALTFGWVPGSMSQSNRPIAWSPDGNYLVTGMLGTLARSTTGTYRPPRVLTASLAGWNEVAREGNDPALSFSAQTQLGYNQFAWDPSGTGLFVGITGSSNATNNLGVWRLSGGNTIVSLDKTMTMTGKPSARSEFGPDGRHSLGAAIVAQVGATPVRAIDMPEFRYPYRWPELIEKWGGTDEGWDKVNERFSYDEETGVFSGR